MSGPSKVIVLDPDPRASRQVQLGFEREGVPAVVGNGAAFPEDAGLVLVGGTDGASLDMVQKARKDLAGAELDIPVVFAGRGVRRHEAERAGADEVVLQPAYLRDVVTVGRLLRGIPAAHRAHLAGSLVETTGVYTLVRALASLGRSAVLTLIRGLRRGEVRFYHGEVTSAQVGLIHGQAALHQLLLWTDARFDFHREDIVRRHQIPLSHEELFADAERFLEGVRESSGRLSPSMVLEQDVARVHSLGKQIPTEVHGVLRMFDGHRVLADVLEDSPYRVFETLRVAQRALEAGLLRIAEAHRPKTTWRAMLSIEEWLVGDGGSDGVVDRTAAAFDSTPVSKPKSGPRKKRRKKRPNTPAPVAPRADIDWGALVPRIVGAEVGPLSGVVPAAAASGEIASREAPREKLEALMDTDKRTRIFPTDIGLEPSVVWNEQELARDAKDAEAWKLAEAEAKARAEAEDKAREAAEAKAKADALEAARREAEAAAIAAERKLARAQEREDLDRAWDDASASFHGQPSSGVVGDEDVTTPRERIEAEIKARAEAESGRVQAEIEAKVAAERAKADDKAKIEAEAKAKAEAEDQAKATLEAEQAKAKIEAETARLEAERAPAEADEQAKIEAEKARLDAEWAKAEAEANARADAEDKAKIEAEKARLEADEKAEIEAEKARLDAEQAKAEVEAKARADAEDKAKIEAEKARLDAEWAKAEAEAKAEAKAKADADEKARLDAEWARAEAEAKARAEADAKAKADADEKAKLDAEWAKAEAEAKARADAEAKAKADADEKAKLDAEWAKAEAETKARAEAARDANLAAMRAVASSVSATAPAKAEPSILRDEAPEPAADEPSDGVVRHISSIDTAPLSRRRPSDPPPPQDDLPKEAKGEITQPRLASNRGEPELSQPSILVADLAAVHTAVSAVAATQAEAAASTDVATPSRELLVSEVRRDAVTAFTDAEEAFFRAGQEKADKAAKKASAGDSFDDLDEGYQPVGFWDRLLGRKPPKKR